jgi:signal transduction histidine kinase
MKSLYLRIYLTIVVVLLLFAALSGWVFQRQIEQERVRAESVLGERMTAWGELIQRSLPLADAPHEEQAAALRDWSQRLRLPLALDNQQGERIATSESFQRRQADGAGRSLAVRLEDGRTLWILRPGGLRPRLNEARPVPGSTGAAGTGPQPGFGPRADRIEAPLQLLPLLPPNWPRGVGLAILLAVLFLAVAAGAFPVVRRLTRRLEALQRGVERFGAGDLGHRVEVSGRDEVAAVASSFNQAAQRVQMLLRSHQSLLANASHELRSPLARMKMAVSLLDDAPPAQRDRLKREIETNVAELDALVEEVLMASRLDAAQAPGSTESVDLLALAVEEAARVEAAVDGPALSVRGEERLLRRALRNLLENARRYGGGEIQVLLSSEAGRVLVRVCDRGPGVPAQLRERIFEPFYRLPGHAEQAGGVGLGLSLVKQIAERHGGLVRCEARSGGGSCFVIELPGTGP